jgi:hypothetical protein
VSRAEIGSLARRERLAIAGPGGHSRYEHRVPLLRLGTHDFVNSGISNSQDWA